MEWWLRWFPLWIHCYCKWHLWSSRFLPPWPREWFELQTLAYGSQAQWWIGVCFEYIPPGTMLADRVGHYWIRMAKMVITRHWFIISVGDDTEKYYYQHYQQKYLFSVPMNDDHEVVLNPPKSWVELCAETGMCDAYPDARSCLQSAISRGFHRPVEIHSTVSMASYQMKQMHFWVIFLSLVSRMSLRLL